MQRFKMRLPVRDMRLVDPNLLTSETGRILVRDNGIVVSIEHVRLIIMAEQVRIQLVNPAVGTLHDECCVEQGWPGPSEIHRTQQGSCTGTASWHTTALRARRWW